MKKILILSGIAACLMTSCLKDDGNYSYTKVQTVDITGLDASYRFILQKDYNLTPTVKTEINEADLEYCWRIGNDTLSHTKNFAYKFTKVPVSNDPLVFEALNKKTGVRYSKSMNVAVVSPFTTGWMMLTDNAGQTTLAFQSYEADKELYQDVYYTVTGQKLQGEPVSVGQMNYQDGASGQYLDCINVIMKDGSSPLLDGNSLAEIATYESMFKGFASAPNISYLDNYWYRYLSSGTTVIITEDGVAYGKIPGSMSAPYELSFEYPYEGDALGYKLAPNMTGAYYANYLIAYDELNKRYLTLAPSYLSNKFEAVNFEGKVNTDDLGENVWMGGNYNINVFSIHENNGEYSVVSFGMDWSGAPSDIVNAKLPSGIFDATSCFAVRADGAYIFASAGKKLYAINVAGLAVDPTSAVVELCEYEGNITSMCVDHRAGQFASGYINDSEFAITIQTSATTSSLLIVNTDLSTHGQIEARYDGVQGKVVSLYKKLN